MSAAHSASPPPLPEELAPPAGSRAALAIVGANALTLVMAVSLGWPLGSLLWPYWSQSVVIGWFARRRILALGRFSTEGFSINDRAVAPTPETKRSTAGFFLIHYGLFHLVYAIMLLGLATPRLADLPWFGVAFAGFLLSHHRSFREHVARDLAGTPNIGTLMFVPYARVLPMHLVILAGFAWVEEAAAWVVAGFVVLKTGADLLMHAVEHRIFAKGGVSLSIGS